MSQETGSNATREIYGQLESWCHVFVLLAGSQARLVGTFVPGKGQFSLALPSLQEKAYTRKHVTKFIRHQYGSAIVREEDLVSLLGKLSGSSL